MLQLQDIINVLEYLNNKYTLHGIFISVYQEVPQIMEHWIVEGSNNIFLFNTIQEFRNAYMLVEPSNIKSIVARSNFNTFKYIPQKKYIFISTEEFEDITTLHPVLNHNINMIEYKFKNYNN